MRDAPAIVLLAHGSPDPDWALPVEQVAARLRALAPARPVEVATLEHGPGLLDILDRLADQGARHVRVVAVFLSGGGRHVKRDIPELVARARRERPHLLVELAGPALGTEPEVLDALARAALRQAGLSSPA